MFKYSEAIKKKHIASELEQNTILLNHYSQVQEENIST